MTRSDLDNAIKHYEKLIRYYKKELEDLPAGKLYNQVNHNTNQLILSLNENGKRIRKTVTHDEKMLRALAKKEFAKNAIKVLNHNLEALTTLKQTYEPFDPDKILMQMTNAYNLLPEEYFFDKSFFILENDLDEDEIFKINRNREWGSAPYKESLYHKDRKTKRTSRGNYVRSKSELLIIEDLYHFGIPMHYDEEHIINGVFLVPDFTFKRWDGEFFFWEYLGMMDDVRYAKHNFKKLDDLYSAGIIPGDNLIVTFDKGDNINMSMIDAIIRNEVIPRL
ncbi:MAG: hypothetical protein IJH43_08520 [Mogibacterium sp.]|nr:hypothetical protein [Mogibacterium sp.]